MRTAMLLTAAFLTVVAGVLLMSCASSHPRHTLAKPEELGDELHVFVSTNAHPDLCSLRVNVHRFRGTATGFWGAENRAPTTIVGSAILEIKGGKVPIPNSAFRDLGEVQYPAQVGFVDDGSPSFFIRGGDAGFAYTARFEVRENRLRKRIVTLDESDFREESRF